MPIVSHKERTTVATVAGLMPLLRAYGPVIEDGALVFDQSPPPDLLPALRVLHTGVRATLAGRIWYGCGDTRKTAAAKPLDPAAVIPLGITLPCVEGDLRWDRIRPDARIDLPRLFVKEPENHE